MPDEAQKSAPQATIERADDFRSLYANNVIADGTAWDLRLTFGQFEKRADGSVVNTQRVSVTMPFGLAKLMMFWVELQIQVHERQMGQRVRIRPDVLPPMPPIPPESQNDEGYVRLHEMMEKARQQLVSNSE
jgi:hypothetical protein